MKTNTVRNQIQKKAEMIMIEVEALASMSPDEPGYYIRSRALAEEIIRDARDMAELELAGKQAA